MTMFEGKMFRTWQERVLRSLALNLDKPDCADIEFTFSEGERTKRLYGISSILELRSNYFRRMFNSRFSDATHLAPDVKLGPADIKSTLRTPRRQVAIREDHDLFKVVLFYLYTDSIQFICSDEIYGRKDDVPTTDNAEGIYAIALRLMLDDLASKAAKFLEDTCTSRNITARAFGKFAAANETVGKIYDQYLIENWRAVVIEDEFEEFFRDGEEDPEEFTRIHAKLRTMIRRQVEYERCKKSGQP